MIKVRRHKTRGYWEVDVILKMPDGTEQRRRRKAAVATKREAEAFGTLLEREMLLPKPAERKVAPTLGEFKQEFLEQWSVENKPSAIVAKKAILRRELIPRFGDVPMDMIDKGAVEKMKAELLGRKLSKKTANNVVTVLSSMMNRAVEAGHLDHAPKLKLFKIDEESVDCLSPQEERALLRAAKVYRGGQWFSMVHFALNTGLRFGELAELRWGDIDLKNRWVRVSRQWYRDRVQSTKGRRTRDIDLAPSVVAVLEPERLQVATDAISQHGPLVFHQENGGRRIHRRADCAIKRMCTLAGIREISWHVCRHTFGSKLADTGAPMMVIRDLMGHQDIKTTARYLHRRKPTRSAIDHMDEVANGDQPGATVLEFGTQVGTV
ncbi:MAG: site-specific integrase [Deltaproteobacteria bacterium]|nr:site-specific integrase [Deltaproteobacteria bacterium]